MANYSGVDVGGDRKGFHVATLDDTEGLHLADLRNVRGEDAVGETVALLQQLTSRTIAVDAPIAAADTGSKSRPCEKALAKRSSGICGIRFTPDLTGLSMNPTYYRWIVRGLELHDALAAAGMGSIECFPTATWTVLGGPRVRSRAAWSREVLNCALVRDAGLTGVPARTNQDERDAIAAAFTAFLFATGPYNRAFWPIVVPEKGTTTTMMRAII